MELFSNNNKNISIACPYCLKRFSLNSVGDSLKESGTKESSMKSERGELFEINEQKIKELEKKISLAEEREKKTIKKIQEESYFKLLEREKMIKDMEQKLFQAQQIALSSSQQNKGEAFEEDMEKKLRKAFPMDSWTEVPKGMEGGDLVQEIFPSPGHMKIGKILWEFKNTKSFQGTWIEKLRSDVLKSGAEVGVLVSKSLSKDAQEIEYHEGVYVVSFSMLIPFSYMLRKNLMDIHYARALGENQDEKISQLYTYITGQTFKQKMSRIASTFRSQKDILEKEKRSMQKLWAQRDKELELALESLATLYGDMLAISGKGLPPLMELELSND